MASRRLSFPNCLNIAQNFRMSFRRSASACRFVMVRAEYLSPGSKRCPYPTYGLSKALDNPYYQKKNIIQRNLNDSAIVQHISNESEDISFDNILKPDTMRTASASPDMQIAFVCLPLKKIVISSKYGVRKDPVTNKYQHHNGLDLRAKFGEPAFAMMHGVVSEVGRDGSRGNYVDIRHGHYKLSYYHLSKILVKQGQIVHPGQVVGLVGSTGRSTGAHLHLTLRKGATSLNPLIILDYVKAMLNKLSDTRRHRF